MPRLLGDELEDDEAEVAMGEEPAEPGSAAGSLMPAAMMAGAVDPGLAAGEATAMAIMRVRSMGVFMEHVIA